MRKLGKVIPAAIANDEVLRMTRAQAAMRRWPEVVGPKMADRSFPDRFGRGTVWVAVEGSAWAQELRMMKDVVLKRLNDLAGDSNLFTEVRFGVRPLPVRDQAVKKEVPPPEEKIDVRELTIGEIAARRLAKWKHEGGDRG